MVSWVKMEKNMTKDRGCKCCGVITALMMDGMSIGGVSAWGNNDSINICIPPSISQYNYASSLYLPSTFPFSYSDNTTKHNNQISN